MEHRITNISELTPLKPKAFVVGALEIMLVRDDAGNVVALEDRCSHADFPLSDGEIFDGQIECSAHGARFELTTGKATKSPALTPVKSFAVRITEKGEIFLTI